MSLPEELTAVQRQALIATCDALHDEFKGNLVSIVLSGSLANGTARDNSDIDLFVAFEGAWTQRRRFERYGVEVDLFVTPRSETEQLLTSSRNDVLQRCYSTGWIIHDPKGFAMRMRPIAANALARPRPAIAESEAFMFIERLHDRVKEYSNAVASGAESAPFLLGILLQVGFDAYYAFKHYWIPAPKGILDELRLREPRLHAITSKLLSTQGTPDDKRLLAQRFAEFVLKQTTQREGDRISPKIFADTPDAATVRIGGRTVTLPKNLSR